MKLDADHSGVCKFGDSLEDHDNFKLVQRNIKDLYKKALKTGELSAISSVASQEQRAKFVKGQQLKRQQESDSTRSKPKRARIADFTDNTDSGNNSYDDDDGDSANSEELDGEACGGNYGDCSEVVNTDEEDGGDEEDDSGEEDSSEEEDDSGEEDSSEEDNIDEDSESDYE